MARKSRLGLPLQTLRNAPDVSEARRVRDGIADLSPDRIEVEGRFDDRLQLDVDGLKTSIAANGQRVPILVRPLGDDRYDLIYGRRRLEACRELGIDVRAIITEADDDRSLRDQLLENQERRDLTFIERALVATALLEGVHFAKADRTARNVAEVLNLHEAGVSQLLGVVRTVGDDLIRAIGPAPGIGRPRWEELKKLIEQKGSDQDALIEVASAVRSSNSEAREEISAQTFLAVLEAAKGQGGRKEDAGRPKALKLKGIGTGSVRTGNRGDSIRIDLKVEDPEFVDWLEANASNVLEGLHRRWKGGEG